jgi:hypothetical protein
MFALFKAVCMDTNDDPAPVRAAASAAGGILVEPSPRADADVSATTWAVASSGVTYHVSLMDVHRPAFTATPFHTQTCEVAVSKVNDGDAVEAVRNAFGLPQRRHINPPGRMTMADIYFLQKIDGRLEEGPHSDSEIGRVMQAGNAWSITIGATDLGTDLQLSHTIPGAYEP